MPEDTREEELDRNANRSVPQICVTTIDNVNHSYGKSEWMLYEYNGSQGIAPLSDLCDIYESYENLRIQPIAPLVKLIVKKHIEAERDKDTKGGLFLSSLSSVVGMPRVSTTLRVTVLATA